MSVSSDHDLPQEQDAVASAQEADQDHRPVSVEGWTCDACGLPVNGQTDDQGWPVMEGDSVRHVG